MKVKIGTKILSHGGKVWHVSRFDNNHPNCVILKTHKDDHIYVHLHNLHSYGKKLRFWHKLFGSIK